MSEQLAQPTSQKSPMPPRGERPGHKFILRTRRHYWYAKQVVRNPMGYPDPCIALPLEADDGTIDRLCQGYTADLLKWIDRKVADAASGIAPTDYDPRRVYDGSVRSACRIYQEHPNSRFKSVKANTKRTYITSLNVVEQDAIAARHIRNLSVIDCEAAYYRWRAPAVFVDDDGEWTDGRERIDRAHDAISMLKTVLRFCAALHLPSREQPHCEQLAKELENWQFEKGGAREQELTYEHASAFIRTALELEARRVLPAGRGLHMAIATAAQFELIGVRQKDVIGEHAKNEADLAKALKRGATQIAWNNGDIWIGYFTWENIPGWVWRVKTSKSKYRHLAEYDLAKRSMLLPLLERVPFAERTGAIVKGEAGLPIRERSHRKWFRQIATAAGIPADVWHYDGRAGSATEADNAGADLDLISAGLGHADKKTTLRYIRRRGAKNDQLAEIRNAARPKEGQSS